MLCCVSKKAAAGTDLEARLGRSRAHHSLALFPHPEDPKPKTEKHQVDLPPDDGANDDVPPILLPCAICARTFKPQSLEKHARICERTAVKRRKPFDSAKQRIQGTELAEFLPKQEKKRPYHEDRTCKPSSSWKQTHDEFLRAIRAARGDSVDSKVPPAISTGAPTRANEKGMCPTCNRQFGIKAYDRHVAWCKERATRLPVSPATNVAKERLEARMKYRAPAMRNRRPTNREKYAPGSAINLSTGNKTSPTSYTSRAKESVSSPNCNKISDSPGKTKPSPVRRSGHNREPPVTSSANKSRLTMDHSISNVRKDYDPFLLAERQLNELLSDTSESLQEGPRERNTSESSSNYPLSHSSAFAKYPAPPSSVTNKRTSLIAPPTEFDDLMSDFSSDSTETNSISKEVKLENHSRAKETIEPHRSLNVSTRLVVLDKSKPFTVNEHDEANGNRGRSFINSVEKSRKILEKVTPKVMRPTVSRCNSVRASSAPKGPERKDSIRSSVKKACPKTTNYSKTNSTARNNNYNVLSESNLSLSSIVSSDVDIKRSNSMFDELTSSFEEDVSSFPSLRSFLKSNSMSVPSPIQHSQQRNGLVSDEELSSPDSYKRQDHGKISADSAYSSLNRKYFNHGCSVNDGGSRLDDDIGSGPRDDTGTPVKYKMSKFCHECGSKFPETAKFCCECGIKRLAL
ncbi:uncharacterized protein LOC105703612 isoform X2 [Orussus abietinus]|uniref:uncharacterized protein LOC105703612 isoform X2 n=1 Tax=Orussus abietinus TaxID=222816 RepID=UPI000625F829|nr:uncharacterized protein LOC105703612 isoform X2 [Orussus abietinus]